MAKTICLVPARNSKVDSRKIQRFGELDRLVSEFKPVADEHKILKDEIASWFSEAPADLPQTTESEDYIIQLTARERERTITNPKKAFELLKRQLGINALVALINIPLGAAVDKFIPRSQHDLFLKEERTGSRKLTCVPKRAPAAPPKLAA